MRGKTLLKWRGSLKNYTLTYMCAALWACPGGEVSTVRWSLADDRLCSEANVVEVAIRDPTGIEIGRAACADGEVRVDREGEVIVEAVGYRGTVLYRARAVISHGDGPEPVVLRFVGGDP